VPQDERAEVPESEREAGQHPLGREAANSYSALRAQLAAATIECGKFSTSFMRGEYGDAQIAAGGAYASWLGCQRVVRLLERDPTTSEEDVFAARAALRQTQHLIRGTFHHALAMGEEAPAVLRQFLYQLSLGFFFGSEHDSDLRR